MWECGGGRPISENVIKEEKGRRRETETTVYIPLSLLTSNRGGGEQFHKIILIREVIFLKKTFKETKLNHYVPLLPERDNVGKMGKILAEFHETNPCMLHTHIHLTVLIPLFHTPNEEKEGEKE